MTKAPYDTIVRQRGINSFIIITKNVNMSTLYKYLFYKIYNFYLKIFKEKDIPHYFSIAIITLISVANIIGVRDMALYFINPSIVLDIAPYDKYFGLIVLIALLLYINLNKKYLLYLVFCKQLSKNKRKFLGWLSIVYVLIVFVVFFWSGYLIRGFSINH
jgi:hypothetical protein